MLNQHFDYQNDFENLVGELNEISEDVSHYLNFLIERRSLIQQVLSAGIASDN